MGLEHCYSSYLQFLLCFARADWSRAAAEARRHLGALRRLDIRCAGMRDSMGMGDLNFELALLAMSGVEVLF